MEIHGIGPCVLLDTAGFDDVGEIGKMRVAASRRAAESTDLAVILFGENPGAAAEHRWETEIDWIRYFQNISTPVTTVLTQTDLRSVQENEKLADRIFAETGLRPLLVSAKTGEGLDLLREKLIRMASQKEAKRFIMGDLIREGDIVLLVMPQDPQAPEGRLILPEVQTIREALDRKCVAVCVQPGEMQQALDALKKAPALIVTDSQVFDTVYAMKPQESRLTSFSVLFAALKGDIQYYIDSVKAIDCLTANSKVLIAECCTHAPLDEDIGRVKIPAMLRKRTGPGLTVDVTAGSDFPENLDQYDLVIQCGGCMFNRKYVSSRIQRAKDAGVPMTNYGITIAYVKGILDKVDVTG